jgi:glycosyltransferase involved in cell wall biosynthesis
VALGHVGGRSAHKGISLIEATLRRGAYKNLHLTVVDGTLAPGQSIETLWGSTPVTLTAPYRQSEVAQLYSHLDVLLAPSAWPESFGLVTREALSCGLWVVASTLGAVGQTVEEGRNGFIIDVSTTRELSAALSKIDNNPDTYRSPPPTSAIPVRSMSEQAVELQTLYRQLVASRSRESQKL